MRKWVIFFSAIVLGSLLLAMDRFAVAQSNEKIAVLLKINSGIGPAVQDYVKRGIEQAVQQHAAIVVLQIDTPGGLSKSMRGIIKAILGSPVPVITYVAPSGARAASAGTYILYASHIAAMAPGTNLGAATPVSIGMPGAAPPRKGGPSQKDLAKKSSKQATDPKAQKAINDAKAYIRALAELRGRNAQWAEKAVTAADSITAKEAVKLNVVNFMAKTIPNALELANGMKVSVRNQPMTIHSSGLSVKEIKPDWRTEFLTIITDPSVAYILLMLGVYGIFFEFVNPGFIVPGVVGGISLLLAVYALQLLPINYAGLGLIILGVAFLIAELFVTSFGVLGIGGVISFVAGSVLLMDTGVSGFTIPVAIIATVSLITALFFLLLIQLMIRARYRPVVSGMERLQDQVGTVIERNNKPWIKLEGELWQVESVDDLQPGDEVTVIGIQGLILHVRNNK